MDTGLTEGDPTRDPAAATSGTLVSILPNALHPPSPLRDRAGELHLHRRHPVPALAESEFLNGEIVLLAHLHGRSAPANAAVPARVARAAAERVPAHSLTDDDLVAVLPELRA